MSWHKQSKKKPLFEDLIWSKPENKLQAGKLLIIGGNSSSFSSVSLSYKEALTEGAGQIRIILPLSLKKALSKILSDSDFAPVNPSGSFSTKALADFIENTLWADMVLFAGDFGRNSETAILLEKYLLKTSGPVVLNKEAVDFYISSLPTLSERKNITLILNLSQLQELAKKTTKEITFKFSSTIDEIAHNLELFSKNTTTSFVVYYQGNIWCAHNGKVSSTPTTQEEKIWSTQTAAKIAVWLMQNPDNIFESLTTAVL